MNAGELMVLFGLQTDSASFGKAENLVKSLKRTVTALIGVESVKAVTNFVEETAHAGTHILGMATSLGMSTKAFQEWSLVAQKAGSDGQQFSVGVSMFERNLKEFAAGRGSKRFKEAMHAVGLSSQDARKDLAGPDGVNAAIFKVADAYQKMGNTANRAAINTGLFGQRARGMAQDLSQGSAALRAQIEEFRAHGQIVSEADLKKLKQVDNTILDLKMSLKTMAMEAVAAFGPEIVDMLRDAAAWLRENRDIVKDGITAALKTVAFLFVETAKAAKLVVEVVRWFNQELRAGNPIAIALFSVLGMGALGLITKFTMIGGLLKGILTFAGAIGIQLVSGFIAVGRAIGAAFIATGPAGWIIAAIAGIAIAVYEIIEHWDEVKAGIEAAAEALKKFVFGSKEANDALQDASARGDVEGIYNSLRGDVKKPSVPAMSPAAASMAAANRTQESASHFGSGAKGGDTHVTATVHMTNHGVKDAEHAGDLMGNALDRSIRHAVDGQGRTPK